MISDGQLSTSCSEYDGAPVPAGFEGAETGMVEYGIDALLPRDACCLAMESKLPYPLGDVDGTHGSLKYGAFACDR